ncbi:NAD(P)H-dependent oxidoreductase [Maritalea sp.]|uniref:NAD(P)H-dependent oxidoreductase n=1 Tax=Maritalea sp. TaxID=2003361 RepID=UPI003EF234FA
MTKTLVLSGHPRSNSFTQALASAYVEGVRQAGSKATLFTLPEIELGPSSTTSLPTKEDWTSDMAAFWQAILEADHIVIAHPLWWGTMPSELKALFDQLLVSGEAYKYVQGQAMPDGLLAGRTAEIIMTSDTPDWYYKLGYHSAQSKLMKNQILKFVGLKPIRTTHVSPVRTMSEKIRSSKLAQVKQLGCRQATAQQKMAA